MNSSGIIELDVHEFNTSQAKTFIDSRIKKAGRDIYRIRIIHGYHNGTALRDMIRSVYKHNPKVLRIELGLNPGQTDLILRELI